MKPNRHLALACVTLSLGVHSSVHAADLYWDSNGATVGTGGAGTWDSTSNLWRAGTDTGTLQAWNSTTDVAILGGTAGTMTLSTALTAAGVTVLSSASGDYTIKTLNGSTANLLTLGANAPIIVPSGKTLNFTGPSAGAILGGTGTAIFQGGGTINLTGTNRVFAGTLRATGTGTTLIVNGTNALDNASASAGLESMNGAIIRVNGTNNYRRGATLDGGTLECGNIRSLQAQVNNILTINGTSGLRSVVANSMSAGNLGGLAGNGSTARSATVNVTNDPGGIDLEYKAGWRNGTLNKLGTGTMLITSASTFNRNDNYTAASNTSYSLSVNAGTVINEGTVMSPAAVTSTGVLRSGASTGVFDQIDINGGVFELSRITGLFNDSFTHATGMGDINFGGGTLRYATGFNSDASALFGPIGASGGTVDTNGNDVTFGSALGGSGGFGKKGAGTLTLGVANTYSGVTTISGGVLAVSADNALGTAPVAATAGHLTLNGGTLATSTSFPIAGNRGIALGASGGTLDVANGTTLTYGGIAAGAGALTKTSAGTLILAGTNSYTGATTVTGGTLVIDGNISSSSLTSLSAVAVLGGSGTLGATTIAGTHSPGNSPGLQTFAGDLTYQDGSTLVWELIADTIAGRGSNFDAINLTGSANLAFTGTTTVNLAFASAGSTVDWSDTLWDNSISGTNGWKLFDLANGSISGLEHLSIAASPWVDANGVSLATTRPLASFSLFQDGNDLYLNYSAIPEPGSLLGLGVLLGAPTLMRRRRQG